MIFIQLQGRGLGHIAQSVTCLATDASLTADPRVASLIPAGSHTIVQIDHEIISMFILLSSAESFMKGCCQLQVCHLGQRLQRLSYLSEVIHSVLSWPEVSQSVLSGPEFTQTFIYRGRRLPRLSYLCQILPRLSYQCQRLPRLSYLGKRLPKLSYLGQGFTQAVLSESEFKVPRLFYLGQRLPMMSYLGQQLPKLLSRSEVTHAVLSGSKLTQTFIYRGQRLPRLSSGSEVT